jgi:transposase-like protein
MAALRKAADHAEEVTGNVAMTCRYYGISRQVYYRWLRRYQEQGVDGLPDLSRRPHHSPNATLRQPSTDSEQPQGLLHE